MKAEPSSRVTSVNSWEAMTRRKPVMRIACCVLTVLLLFPDVLHADELACQNDTLADGERGVVRPGYLAGDLDDDGDVDLDDFAIFFANMTGPSEAGKSVGDLDGDGDVDMVDFLAVFQQAFTGSPCNFGRKYALASKSGSATGCSAEISTRTTTLCGEPTAKSSAGSAAWAGVTKFQGEQPVKWAQIGYLRFRKKDGSSSDVFVRRYAETVWGPNEQDRDLHLDSAPSAGFHEYKCYLLTPLLGAWKYEYDGSLFYTFARNEWKNVTGTHYQWAAEIFNEEDQMVGTSALKCHFSDCQYSLNWGTFQNADITTGDLYTSDSRKWGIERVNATDFHVWDKDP